MVKSQQVSEQSVTVLTTKGWLERALETSKTARKVMGKGGRLGGQGNIHLQTEIQASSKRQHRDTQVPQK